MAVGPVKFTLQVQLAAVDFTNFCPIRQQLMSNFMRAVRFSPLPWSSACKHRGLPILHGWTG